MTTRTIVSLYDISADAEQTVRALQAAGIPREQISVARHVEDYSPPPEGSAATAADNHAVGGASTGAVAGGGIGLLAGLGVMAIPGIGPVVAAGWVVSTLTGAAIGALAGGVIGAVIKPGARPEPAPAPAEDAGRAETLVTVQVDDLSVATVEHIMRQHRRIDPDKRGLAYRRTGWRSFDETSPRIASEEVEHERARLVRDHAVADR